jgi:aspartate/methionine/tyrosine aminotransferase
MLANRTNVFTESVIREMTRLSIEHGAVNLAQGYPDFPAPEELKAAGAAAVEADHNQYTVTWGTRALREALSRKLEGFNRIKADPETEITITCGATEAMMATMLALVEPGDEVIVFEPFYENYVPDAALAGAKLVFVPLHPPTYEFDPDQLRAAFSPRTKAIVVNTPNNPSGRVLTRAELETIAALCIEFNIVAITDEIYEYIIFDGHRHVSLASLPGMAERTVTISGFSKTFSVTGWRLGYVVAPAPLSAGIRKVHDFLTVCAPAPMQEAALRAVALSHSFSENLVSGYDAKRDQLRQALLTAGFACVAPQGAYYIMADIRPVTDLDDSSFALQLVRDVGVAAVPGSSFHADKQLGRSYLRFTFSKSEETLRRAGERLLTLHDRRPATSNA